jgi:hypothetical protein
MSLTDELGVAAINRDDLMTLLASYFPFVQWHGANSIIYCTDAGEVAVTLTYSGNRIVNVEADPSLSEETREMLRDDIAALTDAHETVVWRDVFFNILPVDGYWRYRDEWQIVPAPPQAPRPDVVIADHPFIVELRLPSYPSRTMLDATIRMRRAWELQLILNLALRGPIKRFSARGPDHTWAYVPDSHGKVSAEWVQPGYSSRTGSTNPAISLR